MFNTNRKYIISKQLIKKRVGRIYHYSNDLDIGNYGGGLAGVHIEHKNNGTHYKKWTYNDSSIRKMFNDKTKAKIRQKMQNIKNLEDIEDVQLPQNGEHKKMSDYAYWF